MYYGFENIVDIDFTWDKYHVHRHFNSNLIITSADETLVFETSDCIQTIVVWPLNYPIIVCISTNYVKVVKFGERWVENVLKNYAPLIYENVSFISQADPTSIIRGTNFTVISHGYTNGKYELNVNKRGMSYASNNKILRESNFDRMYICNSDILYRKSEQWIHVTFDEPIIKSTQLKFNRIGDSGLYSAINPVYSARCDHSIMFFDVQNRSRTEFGYLVESGISPDDSLKVGSKIYGYKDGKTTIFQPVTANNRMYLMKPVKDHICFLYWLIKQKIFSKYEIRYYLPKYLLDKYVLEFL